jgi:hypothetical protein
MIQRLNELLRFDIRLYEYFKSELKHQHTFSSAYGSKYHFFSLRQNLIRKMAKLFNFK